MIKKICYTSKKDGVKLYADFIYDENSTKGIVEIFHGMAEHKERYQYFCEQLLKNGFAVLNADERGHGESAIIKGYFADEDGWERNLEDLYGLYELAKQEKDLPLYVFGHSMGSLVARSFVKRYDSKIQKVAITGMSAYNSASSVAILLAKIVRAFKGKEYRSSFLNQLSLGSFNKAIVNPRTDFDWLSVNTENVDRYLVDEDCGYCFTTQGFYDLFIGMSDAYSKDGWKKQNLSLPIKFFSGEFDPCMGKEKGMKYAVTSLNELGYQNVYSKIYLGLRHEILQEKERDQVIQDILDFYNE